MLESTSPQYGVVLVTTASRSEGEAIAKALVAEKLAACVNLVPIHSVYTWQGETYLDREWQLIIKTDLIYFEALAARITTLHSYEVPEIIALPMIRGTDAYLGWIDDSLDR
jgi:periplasmic divalent cation tolerance protein